MAVIPVKKTYGSSLWMWLIGLLLLLVIGWFVWQMNDSDRDGVTASTPVAVTSTAGTSTTGPAATAYGNNTDAGTAATAGTGSTNMTAPRSTAGTDGAPVGQATVDRVTDAATYASTNDKLLLVGREAVLSNVSVVRVVGPKSFTLASGSEEFLVLIDQDLNQGVGTQGQIDVGNTINLKGNFQRLQQEEIDNISSNRFRDLTEQERDWLKKTPVYLQVTEFGKGN